MNCHSLPYPVASAEPTVEGIEQMQEAKPNSINVVGTSMEPTITDNSICKLSYDGEYEVGDIIVFHEYYENELQFIAHRIVEVDNGFITQGDNVDAVDPWVLSSDNVFGEIPKVTRFEQILWLLEDLK